MSTIRNANIATIVAQYTHEYRTPYRPKIAFLSTRLLMKRLSASRPSRSTAVRSCQQVGPRWTRRSWAVSGPYRARYARTTGLWSTSSYDGYGRRRTRNPLQTAVLITGSGVRVSPSALRTSPAFTALAGPDEAQHRHLRESVPEPHGRGPAGAPRAYGAAAPPSFGA